LINLGAAAQTVAPAASSAQVLPLEIPALPAAQALRRLVELTKLQLVYSPDVIGNVTTKAIKGNFTAKEALVRMLDGASIEIIDTGANAVTLRPTGAAQGRADSVQVLQNVYVFGNALAHIGDTARTGTRTDADPMTLPMSVSSVDKELLQQQQAITLRDAVANVAGASQLNSDGSFVMRGFTAGIMRNGNLQVTGLGFDAPLVSVSKVEVVKGPEAIIAGVNAGYAGVINVISKTPETKAITEMTGMIGSRGYYEAGVDVNRVVTADKSLLVRFVGSKQGAGSTLNGYDGSEKTYAAPSVTWRSKSTGTELTGQYEYQKGRTAPDLEVFTDQPSLSADLKMVRFGPKDTGAEKRNTIATVSGSQRINEDWEVAVKYSDDRTTSNSRLLLDGVATPYGFPFPAILNIGATNSSKYSTKSSKAELKGDIVTGPLEHKLLFAYDVQTSDVRPANQYNTITTTDLTTGVITDQSSTLGDLFGGLPTPVFTAHFKIKETGALVMDQITYGNWIALVGWREIRYDPDNLTSEAHDKLSKSLPSLGVVYRATRNLSLYGNASKGFTPNIAELGFDGKPVPPESAQQYELGLKMQLPQQKLAASVALFKIDQKNVATPDPAHLNDLCGIGACYLSIPGLRSHGIELEVSGEIYKGLGIRANFSYTARSDSDAVAATSAYARNQASLWAIYKFGDEFVGQGWWVGAGVQGRSARSKYPDVTDVANAGFGRVDANLGYQAKHWSFTAGGKNLANKRIYTLGSGVAGSGVVQQLREFFMTARYSFE